MEYKERCYCNREKKVMIVKAMEVKTQMLHTIECTIDIDKILDDMNTYECNGGKCRNTIDCSIEHWCISCHFDVYSYDFNLERYYESVGYEFKHYKNYIMDEKIVYSSIIPSKYVKKYIDEKKEKIRCLEEEILRLNSVVENAKAILLERDTNIGN